MPKGKTHDAQERACIAKAFAIATLDKVKGKDQQTDDFHQKIHDEVKKMEPTPTPDGKYSNRTGNQLYSF